MSIAKTRHEYIHAGLSKKDLDEDPIRQFRCWFDQAMQANPYDWIEANAMTLATATPDGRPSARIVLLKEFGEEGFVFFTNYHSRKGNELAANPRAAAVFWWPALARQVRIEGSVEKAPAPQSESYYHSRPRGSQLGALVSDQSRRLSNRQELEKKLKQLEATYADTEIPLPENWGGYVLRPTTLEFWQGRSNRLHDRLLYYRDSDGGWKIERLAP